MDYNSIPQMKLLGEDIKVEKAPEPTDIIWENRQYHHAERKLRTICAWIVILCLLIGSFIVIFKASAYSIEVKNMFPLNNHCPALLK
jgi:hypothetical protein